MAPTPDPNSVGGAAKQDEASLKVPSKDPKKKDDKKEEDLVSFSSFYFVSENITSGFNFKSLGSALSYRSNRIEVGCYRIRVLLASYTFVEEASAK